MTILNPGKVRDSKNLSLRMMRKAFVVEISENRQEHSAKLQQVLKKTNESV